ncbi:MAG: ATP-binding cassette domain-containing protein, partial [Ktedonobacterales bacterium]
FKPDGWWIENRSQSSFIRVDRRRVPQARLDNGAIVNLGDTTSFVFLTAADDEPVHDEPDEPPMSEIRTVKVARVTEAPAPAASGQSVASGQPKVATDAATQVATQPSGVAATVAQVERPLSDDTMRADATQLAPLTARGIPTLEVTSNTSGERHSYALTKPVTNIGRDASNDIVLADRIVSGLHLRIVRQGNSYVLIHPNPDRPKTLNGLLYQGHKIAGDERFTKTLANGDFFRIGDENGTLITLAYSDGVSMSQAELTPLAPIALRAPALTIGRSSENDVVLAHPQVSAHHARLTREGATYRITDLHSANHVYVNGAAVATQLLKTGDDIRIGPYRLVYEGNQLTQYDESNFIRIDALHLKKSGSNDVTLLDDITLAIPPRAFVALVGGSGAGKSTLLDALNGLRPAQQGEVLYNGQDYYRNLAAYSTQLGYVPQDDIVHRDLTVERALYYAAKLRLPGDFTDEQIEQRIAEVLDEVELTQRRTLLVKKLSGGQRKRVSIALELLANPSIFFLDEPTSGLDPGLDRKMMFLLRKLADRGHTIVLVTHATNNINSCDYVCFLCAGGRLAYFGPPEQAKTYFGKADFAEIYSSLEPTEENPGVPADAATRFRSSPEYQQYVITPLGRGTGAADATIARALTPAPPISATQPMTKPRESAKRSGSLSQFWLLSLRYLELLRNDRGNLLILLLQAPIIALLLVVMLRFQIGAGIFNADQLTNCRTQVITPSGPLALPQAQHSISVNCQAVIAFLKTNPNGQVYAQQHGGINAALQNFLLPGPGSNAQQALFIMAFATILFGCINGTREFVKEAPIYRRERAVNLGILPYMFSKIAVLGLLCLFQSAVFVLVVQLGEPLQQGVVLSPLLEVYITLALTSLAGLMIGLTISAIAPNADRAISFVPIILLPQVIFSGAIIPLKDWGSQIIAVVFPSRWAMTALGTSIGLHSDTVDGDHLFGSDPSYHGTLYSIYTQSDALHRLLLSWGALAAISIALMIVIGVFLQRKDKQG